MDIKLACSHQHSLIYLYGGGRVCEVCGKKIPGASYTCRECKVWLHRPCASKVLQQQLPHEINHPLHSQHQLQLQMENFRHFFCDKCLYISGGSRYNCSSCDFNLDLTCAASSSVNDPRTDEDGKKKMIQHYIHYDKLRLFKYRKIKEPDYNCSWCEKRLLDSDVCYGCIPHKLFLHEECCNKIPRTLDHPFHPSHPLRLHYTYERSYCSACGENIFYTTLCSHSYWCQICTFCLDFRCAKLFPTLKHECHDHLLTFFRKISTSFQEENHFQCNVCNMVCDANFYRCLECDFSIHLRCLQIPSSTNHKYHRHPLTLLNSVKEDNSGEYYCDVCEKERNPNHPVYCCKECKFIVHIECILHKDKEVPWSAPQSMDSKALIMKEMDHNEGTDDIHTSQQLLIQPLIHEHPMKFYEVTEKLDEKQYCNGCRLLIQNGPSYICTKCPDRPSYAGPGRKYYLHEKCAKLPYEIQHPSHSTHPLYLYPRHPPMGYFVTCDECRDICQGFIYLCEECNFKLDVKCALTAAAAVSRPKDDQVERVTQLHHFTHHHKLILGNSSDPLVEIECSICQLPILGPAYFCPIPDCARYIVHESCLGLPQKLQVPFHDPDHMFVIGIHLYTEDSRCCACGLGFKSFRYSCEQCDDFKLHSICANSLRRPLKYGSSSHLHNLYYFGTQCQLLFLGYYMPLFCCSKCRENCEGRPFYRCLECPINYHLECVPIPHVVKSSCHVHPLVLKDSFTEDDTEEYYCDVCEEERYGKDHVYCCGECDDRFVGHIECVLAKVENVVSYLEPLERKESEIHEIANSASDYSDDD